MPILPKKLTNAAHNAASTAVRIFPAANPDHQRLYWCHDVLRLPIAQYTARLGSLGDEEVLQEMIYELYAATAIERSKFDRIRRCLRWAVASFVVWVVLIAMTIAQ